MRKERFFCLFSLLVTRRAGHVGKRTKVPILCLRKNKKPEFFYISILTSASLAAFNPKIRAFRSEIAKHLPTKLKFMGMF